jgi:hypothetical protein
MRKVRVLAAALLLAAVLAPIQTQEVVNLDALNTDISTLFTALGRDIMPALHRAALAGNDLVGEAQLRSLSKKKRGFYVAIPGVTATILDGVAGGVLNSTDPDLWKFTIINIPGIIEESIGTTGTTADIYSMATDKAAPLPALNLGLGFPLPWGTELLLNGFYLPGALVEWGVGFAGEDISSKFTAVDPQIDMITVGGIFRKNILSDRKGFWRPSLSIGASYIYSHFGFKLNQFSLSALDVEVTDEDTGGMGDLTMDGELGFSTTAHSFGAIVHVSKTLLWILTPFAKFGAYYHINSYSSDFAVDATLSKEDDPLTTTVDESSVINQKLDAPVDLSTADVSFLASTGLEIKILPITISTCLTLDLEQPLIDVDEFALNGFRLNGLSATASFRIQI